MDKINWLDYKNSIEEYIEPRYYDTLLKKYSFGKKSDIQLFSRWFRNQNKKSVLELGSGSGRISSIAVRENTKKHQLTLVDLSERMINFTKNKFAKEPGVRFFVSDSLEFMEKSIGTFDTVFSLWSFSHSTHQHLHTKGLKKGEAYLSKTITKFIDKNMEVGSQFFLIHFDSMSEEQHILMKQWQKVFPIFKNSSLSQSPSKIILDKILMTLDQKNKIRLSVEHLEGDPIQYKSLDQLLEIFLNFHLESFFNGTKRMSEVIKDIKHLASKYKHKDGTYLIKPGCYVYTFTKIHNL